MKRFFAITAFFFLCLTSAFSETVRVGIFPNDALYAKQGIEHNASYLTDFISTINRYNNLQFEYVMIPAEKAAEALNTGLIDILPFGGKGLEFEGNFLLSDVPSAIGSLVLASSKNPDLQNIRIGTTFQAPPDMIDHISKFAEEQNFSFQTKAYPSAKEIIDAINAGEVDAFATIDLGMPENFHTVASITPIFFYMIVERHNAELFEKLNQALSLSFNLNPDFLNSLRKQFVPEADRAVFNFTYREQQFINSKPLIRIAITENQKPYCYVEKGVAKGLIIDVVSSVFEKSGISYEFVPAKTYKLAKQLVEDGKADAIYAIADSLSEQDGRTFKITNSIFKQKNILVTNTSDIEKGKCSFVATRGHQYSSESISPNYAPASIIWCDETPECIKKIKATKNSFSLIPSLEIKYYEQNHLFPGIKKHDEGFTNNLCIGISRSMPSELCSILDKSIHHLSASMMEDYLEENLVTSKGLQAAIKQHPFYYIGIFTAILILCIVLIFMYVYDRTKKKKDRQIANAMNLANRDAMTGLYNHIAYEKLVNKTLEHQTNEEKSALVMIDIDNFKRINDTLGHGTGDLVIVTVANILISAFRQGDIKCRMGGDEFSVFMKNVASREGVEHKLSYLMQEMESVFEKMNLSVPVTCSVGAVLARGPMVNKFTELYTIADKALYTIKEGGKKSFCVSEDEVSFDDASEEAEARK